MKLSLLRVSKRVLVFEMRSGRKP